MGSHPSFMFSLLRPSIGCINYGPYRSLGTLSRSCNQDDLLSHPKNILRPTIQELPHFRLSSQVTTAQSSLVVVADIVLTRRSTRGYSVSIGPNFTKAQAVKLIEKLTVEERKLFLKELKKIDPDSNKGKEKPTMLELKQLAYHNSLPFIGFGFLDNFIMIMAGEYIDLTLGATLGISTMAAAAFGNTLSDMCGIGSAWYVESWAEKLGATPPDLSPDQLEMTSSRVAGNFGRAFGVVLGCIIGMFPLLFIDTKDKDDESTTKSG